jgi:hypothetical protein
MSRRAAARIAQISKRIFDTEHAFLHCFFSAAKARVHAPSTKLTGCSSPSVTFHAIALSIRRNSRQLFSELSDVNHIDGSDTFVM